MQNTPKLLKILTLSLLVFGQACSKVQDLSGTAVNSTPVQTEAKLRITELEYDEPSSDTHEFVEICNQGDAAADLSSVALVLINGANGSEYKRVSLNAMLSLSARECAIVGTPVSFNANIKRIPFLLSQDNMQNGAPDAVALIDGHTKSVLDLAVYEGYFPTANILGLTAYAVDTLAAIPVWLADTGLDPNSLQKINDTWQLAFATPGY